MLTSVRYPPMTHQGLHPVIGNSLTQVSASLQHLLVFSLKMISSSWKSSRVNPTLCSYSKGVTFFFCLFERALLGEVGSCVGFIINKKPSFSSLHSNFSLSSFFFFLLYAFSFSCCSPCPFFIPLISVCCLPNTPQSWWLMTIVSNKQSER